MLKTLGLGILGVLVLIIAALDTLACVLIREDREGSR